MRNESNENVYKKEEGRKLVTSNVSIGGGLAFSRDRSIREEGKVCTWNDEQMKFIIWVNVCRQKKILQMHFDTKD